MKRMIIIGIVLVLLISAVQAIEIRSYNIVENVHFIVVGHIYNDDGDLASDIEVVLLNVRTGESQTFATNERGEYLFDCLNFKKGHENADRLNISGIYGSQEVIIDLQYAGIQCPINKPLGIPVEPIVAGTVLVSVLGGAYYYIKRKKKKIIKEEKQKEMIEEKMSEEEKKKVKIELPEGTRRFVLATILLIAAAIMLAQGLEVPQWLVQLIGIVIAFFFGGHSALRH